MDEESALLMKTANHTVFEHGDDNHDDIDDRQQYFDMMIMMIMTIILEIIEYLFIPLLISDGNCTRHWCQWRQGLERQEGGGGGRQDHGHQHHEGRLH